MGFRTAALVAALALLGPGTASAADPADAAAQGDWSFAFVPFLWLPAYTGKAGVAGSRNIDIDTSISDIFAADLALGLNGQLEAWHRERFGVALSGAWQVLHENDNLKGTPLRFDLEMNSGSFEVFGLYSFGERPFTSQPGSPTWSLQPLLGARVTLMTLELDFLNFGSPDATEAWADPILGACAIFRFGNDNRWNWTLRQDVGGFGAGSDLTWKSVGVLGYDFTLLGTRTSFGIGAQALSHDFENGGFEWDVIQYGPMIGLGFGF